MSRRAVTILLLVMGIAFGAVALWSRPKHEAKRPGQVVGPVGLRIPQEMVLIPEEFAMGSEDGPVYERPVHVVKLSAFWIDKTEVTVRQYRQFVDATAYVTDAEKFGWSGGV
jgi:formylglycine-generating enzyme required for sulfatase activity